MSYRAVGVTVPVRLRRSSSRSFGGRSPDGRHSDPLHGDRPTVSGLAVGVVARAIRGLVPLPVCAMLVLRAEIDLALAVLVGGVEDALPHLRLLLVRPLPGDGTALLVLLVLAVQQVVPGGDERD